jgi:hypothetical protein
MMYDNLKDLEFLWNDNSVSDKESLRQISLPFSQAASAGFADLIKGDQFVFSYLDFGRHDNVAAPNLASAMATADMQRQSISNSFGYFA